MVLVSKVGEGISDDFSAENNSSASKGRGPIDQARLVGMSVISIKHAQLYCISTLNRDVTWVQSHQTNN
jgi:hypothetical protein